MPETEKKIHATSNEITDMQKFYIPEVPNLFASWHCTCCGLCDTLGKEDNSM